MFRPPSSKRTHEFYNNLHSGGVTRGMWGKHNRFDADRIADSISVGAFFVPEVRAFLGRNHHVLDLGCGPGGFLSVLAPLCGQITGVDLSSEFVEACRRTILVRGVKNASVGQASGTALPFCDGCFDRILMVDTLHHLDAVDEVLAEAYRVLRPGGILLVFEPNKMNPLLALMCLLDRNEWGALALGSKRKYRQLLAENFETQRCSYNGLLVGPDSRLALWLAHYLAGSGVGPRLLSWLSPKIFLAARKI